MVESSPRLLSWFHPFTFKRFHVLLNSLFKVLCNFPSRYLFAIGFTEIFSLSSSLRAALGCTLKQPDSIMPRLAQVPEIPLWAYHPLWVRVLVRGTCGSRSKRLAPWHSRSTASTPERERPLRWAHPFSLAVTKGIPFGFFSSAE